MGRVITLLYASLRERIFLTINKVFQVVVVASEAVGEVLHPFGTALAWTEILWRDDLLGWSGR